MPGLTEILIGLNDEPDVLVIFNHPSWDLYEIGKEKHKFQVNQFLHKNGAYLHALELNGLRNWGENRATWRLAEEWKMVMISGGDRHGVEPNANINLTNAASFTEFVHEIRREKKSAVLFMPQYAEPWKLRMLSVDHRRSAILSGVPAGLTYLGREDLSSGCERSGSTAERAMADGTAPWELTWGIRLVQLMGRRLVSGSLRMVWSETHELRLALGERDG